MSNTEGEEAAEALGEQVGVAGQVPDHPAADNARADQPNVDILAHANRARNLAA